MKVQTTGLGLLAAFLFVFTLVHSWAPDQERVPHHVTINTGDQKK